MSHFTYDELLGDQESAFDYLRSSGLFEPDGEHFVLQGYAGTGKTGLTGAIAHYAIEQGLTVVVATPTHQAAHVSRQHLPSSVEVRTIHSMLALEVKWQRGNQVLRRAKNRNPDIPRDALVIVEEASMVGKYQLWPYLREEMISTASVSWLFVGDPAQLPPVQDEPSPALNAGVGVQLEKPLRVVEGSPLTEVATHVRKHGVLPSEYPSAPSGVMDENGREKMMGAFRAKDAHQVVSAFVKRYNGEAGHSIILAHTNKKVDRYNQRARHRLFPETTPEEPWAEGMPIKARDTYYNPDTKDRICHASQEFLIDEIGTTRKEVVGHTYDVFSLEITPVYGGMPQQVLLPTPEEKERLEKHTQNALTNAKANPSQWSRFWGLKEAFPSFRPAFATTVTKSQGSEWETVYVDTTDFYTAGDDRDHLLYTAVTRAAKNLVIVQ